MSSQLQRLDSWQRHSETAAIGVVEMSPNASKLLCGENMIAIVRSGTGTELPLGMPSGFARREDPLAGDAVAQGPSKCVLSCEPEAARTSARLLSPDHPARLPPVSCA